MASCPHVSSIRKQITCCNLSLLSLLSTSSALRKWVCRKAKRGRLKRHEKRGRKSMKTCEEKGKRRGWDKGNVGKEKASEEMELKTKEGGEKQGEKVNLIIFKDLWSLIFLHYFSKFMFLSSSLSLNPYFVLHLQHYPTYCIPPFLNFTYPMYICHSSHISTLASLPNVFPPPSLVFFPIRCLIPLFFLLSPNLLLHPLQSKPVCVYSNRKYRTESGVFPYQSEP